MSEVCWISAQQRVQTRRHVTQHTFTLYREILKTVILNTEHLWPNFFLNFLWLWIWMSFICQLRKYSWVTQTNRARTFQLSRFWAVFQLGYTFNIARLVKKMPGALWFLSWSKVCLCLFNIFRIFTKHWVRKEVEAAVALRILSRRSLHSIFKLNSQLSCRRFKLLEFWFGSTILMFPA